MKNKKVSRADEAMDELMKVIKLETERYDSLTGQERMKSAATIAMAADKIQKLEDTTNTKRSGTRDFWAKVAAITAETGVGVAGLYLTQKNMKYIRAYEEENVIRGECAKSAAKAGLGLFQTALKIVKFKH